ncbi:MAG: insulinase family protein [Chloroflexi bacterium]|nr:insulinase family protein [Chloroflexota bacterium]
MTVSWDITTLDNGLRVVTTPVPTAQSVSVSVFMGVGSRAEEEGTKGLAHFLEHMVFKGTERRPTAIDIAEAIEGAGGTLNAYTAKEVTCFWDHVPFDRLEVGLEVLADMLASSRFDPDEIERERSVILQEIRRTRDQPSAWVGELLGRALFGDQPLGWPTAGEEETVASLGREHFLGWLETWYLPRNVVVSVAGNTDRKAVVKLVRRYFGEKANKRAISSFQPVNGRLPAQRLAFDERPITQANLAIGLPGLARKDPDRYVLLVLNSVLGRGMSSRLFKEVRERRGLAYSVGSVVSRHSDSGVFAVTAGVDPQKLKEAVPVIMHELARLTEEPVGADELAKARDYTIGGFRLSLETPMALAQRAGENLLTMGEIEPIESVVEKLHSVDADDMLRVARRIFQRAKATLALVGPKVRRRELAKLLQV